MITGRTRHFLSLTGEHLSVENMNKAIELVSEEFNISIPEYTVVGFPYETLFAHKWYVATNQWKQLSDVELNQETIRFFEQYCDEFLIHAVDVEGKQSGIQQSLVSSLAAWVTIPTTYAGGARSFEDLALFRRLSQGKLDITVGSALDILGGKLSYEEVVEQLSNPV